MFERFLAFIKELSGDAGTGSGMPANSAAVAAAALLFHIMDADGIRADAERQVLEREIGESFAVDGDILRAVLAEAEEAERNSVDLYQFTSILMQRLDEAGRIEFIGMMWEIAYADGVRDEVEDNIVWRVAELLAVERADRIRMRREVERKVPAGAAPIHADDAE